MSRCIKGFIIGILFLSFGLQVDADDSRTYHLVSHVDTVKANLRYEQAAKESYDGKYAEALQSYKEAFELSQQAFGKYNNRTAAVASDLAIAYSDVYNNKMAIATYQIAMDIWEKVEKKNLLDFASTCQSFCYQLVNYGDYQSALRVLEKLNKVYLEYPQHLKHQASYSHATRTYLLANIRVLSAANQTDKALPYLKILKQRALGARVPDKDEINYLLGAYQAVVHKFYNEKLYKQSLYYTKEALEIAEKYKMPFYVMAFNAHLAATFNGMELYKEALLYSQRARESYQFQAFSASQYALALIQAMAYDGMGDYQQSTNMVRVALSEIIVKNLGKDIPLEKINGREISHLNSSNFINIFSKSAELFLHKFQKQKQLSDLKIAKNLFLVSSDLFKEYYLKGEYNDEINRYYERITRGLLMLGRLTSNKEEKQKLINLVERNASQHLIKAYDNKLAVSQLNERVNLAQFDVQQIQEKLTPDRAIIKYYVAGDQVFLIKITKQDIQLKELGNTERIRRLASAYLENISKIDGQYNTDFQELRKVLVWGYDKPKLTIVPDGFLNRLAFEPLVLNNSDLSVMPILSYSYSLPMWLINQNERPVNNSMLAFAPFYRQESNYVDLKYARQEAQVIAKAFDGELFLGENATKERWMKQKDAGIIHLAMHADVFEDDFSQSALVFANQEKLYFSELYEMHVPADLVVLSACNTGQGKLLNGEGIMSLARSFTHAGVKSTVLSLWQVPDKETAEIMNSFYLHLKQGREKDEALALAKAEFLENNPFKQHPFYWAGFVVNGDTRAVVRPMSFWYWILIAGMGITLLSIAFLIKRNQ